MLASEKLFTTENFNLVLFKVYSERSSFQLDVCGGCGATFSDGPLMNTDKIEVVFTIANDIHQKFRGKTGNAACEKKGALKLQ